MPNKSVFIYLREMNSDASSIINKNSSIFIHVNMIWKQEPNNDRSEHIPMSEKGRYND